MKRSLFLTSLSLFSMQALFSDPTVTSVSNNFGPTTGGNPSLITIVGTEFTGATSVDFGDAPALFSVVDDSTITIAVGDVPDHVAGTVNVTVTNGSGISLPTAHNYYTYQAAAQMYLLQDPPLTSVTPFTSLGYGTPLFLTNTQPFNLAFLQDGSFLYVSKATNPSQKVNPLDNAFTNLPVAESRAIVIPPNSPYAYTCSSSGIFHSIHLATNGVDTKPGFPFSLASTLVFGGQMISNFDGSKLYFPNGFASKLVIFDTTTGAASNPVMTTTGLPVTLTLSPDGAFVYAVFSVGGSSQLLTKIDTATQTEVTTGGFPLQVGPFQAGAMCVTPDNNYLYIAYTSNNTFARVDLNTTAVTQFPLGFTGVIQSVQSMPDSQSIAAAIYVNASSAGYVFIQSGSATAGALQTSPVASGARNLVAAPSQPPAAVFDFSINGGVAHFDASKTVDPTPSTSLTYSWDFGDSTTTSTNSPTVSHTYTSIGNYTVTLTVSSSSGTSTAITYSGKSVINNGSSLATYSTLVNVQSIFIIPPKPSSIESATNFKGALKTSGKKLKLKAKWKQSPSSGVSAYHIYEGKKRIRNIASGEKLEFTKKIKPLKYYLSHRGKLKKRLYNRYKVRAVNGSGQESASTHLKIR